MKRNSIILAVLAAMLLPMAVSAQSIKLDNKNLKTQRLFLAKDILNLDYDDFGTVAVAGNCDYTTSTADNWLTVRRMSNGNTAIFAETNYSLSPREGTVTFNSADGTVERKLTVVQGGYDPSDYAVPIAGGTASSSQSGEGIERSFDGNYSTLYHSSYGNTVFPVTLTYTLKEASHVDYALYTPRQDGGTNGNIKEMTVYYQLAGTTSWEKLGDYNLGGSSNPAQIDFGKDGVDNVKGVRFIVRSGMGDSGTGGFVSCAEMGFYSKNPFMGSILSEYFADDLCTKLKDGITRDQLDGIAMQEIRNMALALYDGTYSQEFRVGEYSPVMPVWQLRDEVLHTYYGYNNHENPTGITFAEDELVIALVEGITTESVSLKIRNFGPTVFAESNYGLKNGLNIIRAQNKGNGYISYYTSNYKTAPNVKIHFLNGTEQGYFSPKYKGHTNEDWKRLLANAKGDCLDMHGQYVDCVFPVSSFRANCPNDGVWLMQTYEDVVKVERDIMGIFKYGYDFPNRQATITVASSAGLYHASNDGFCVPVNALRDPTSRTYYDFWGAAHELGHVNQTVGMKWIGLTEVTNNIKSAYVEHMLRTDGYHRLEHESKGFRYYNFLQYNVLKGGQFLPHVNGDVFCTLIPFWQLLVYTRIGEVQPDAYPDLYENMRKSTTVGSMSDGQQQVNFMRQWCNITKTNYLPYFEKVGLFKTLNQEVNDYSTRTITITKAMLDALQRDIEAAGYPEAPEALYFITVNNYKIFAEKAALQGNTVGQGCVRSGENVRIQHSQWKNVVGFETYKADGTLLHMTNFGHGEGSYTPQYTNCVWKASEQPAYIMAVGYDGTRIKCYEP